MNSKTLASLLISIAFAALVVLAVWRSSTVQAHAPAWRTSLATQFGSKTIGDPITKGITYDKLAGSMFACGGKMDPMAFSIAHRTLPCGSVVEVCRKSLCTFATVRDRGPYFAVPTYCTPRHSHKCWLKGKPVFGGRPAKEANYRWAHDLDLMPRVAWAIRLGGKNMVRWRIVFVPRRALRRITR